MTTAMNKFDDFKVPKVPAGHRIKVVHGELKTSTSLPSDRTYVSWEGGLHYIPAASRIINSASLKNGYPINRNLSENDLLRAVLKIGIEKSWCDANGAEDKSKSLQHRSIGSVADQDCQEGIRLKRVRSADVMSVDKQNVNKSYSSLSASGAVTVNGGRGQISNTLSCKLEQRSRSQDLTKKHSLSSSVEHRSKSQEIPRKFDQDHYSVLFDVLEGKPVETFKVKKGSNLRDIIGNYIERHGGVPCLSQVCVYLDQSTKPISLDFDSFKLAGSFLTVKNRDNGYQVKNVTASIGNDSKNSSSKVAPRSAVKEDRKESFRKQTQNQKSKRGLMSAEENAQESVQQEGSWKPAKHKTSGRLTSFFTNPFKNDKDKLEALIEQLRQYDQTGIPTSKASKNNFVFVDHEEYNSNALPTSNNYSTVSCTDSNANIYFLEKHWADIVHNPADIPENIRKQQDVLWELVQTEVDYINLVKVITDLFLACLVSLQQALILNEIEVEKLFNNIAEVHCANEEFWTNYILPMLCDARNNGSIMNPQILRQGFVQFDSIFKPYTQYCVKQPSCLQYLKSKNSENELFKAYLAWCESQKECSRLRLMDLLVMPMQRLTKYSLLLERIRAKTTDDAEMEVLQIMNQSVQNFVFSVNSAIRQQHEQARLASIIDRIESYDVLESSNDDIEKKIKEHCQLDLTRPMPGCSAKSRRNLLLEGSNIKLKDASSSSKIDVHCFLFTDMLLVCKATSKTKHRAERVKVIRQPYMVERMDVHELKDGNGLMVIYLNEYDVVTAAFILQCHQDTKLWYDSILKAQALYQEAKKPEVFNIEALKLEDEFYYDPSMCYLAASSRSPRDSSRPSLMHSNSGSTDISDSMPCPPAATPNCHARGISLEFGEPRGYNMSSDEGSPDQFHRTRGSSRHQISPKLERRAFLMKSSSSTGPGSPVSSNMLTVSHPYHFADTREVKSFDDSLPPPSLTVPSNKSHLFPDMRVPIHHNLIRSMPVLSVALNKPPLVKTKNIPHANSTSALVDAYLCAASPTSSYEPRPERMSELNGGTLTINESLKERMPTSSSATTNSKVDSSTATEENGNVKSKRNCRQERRYHTADTLDSIKRDINKDSSSIQKRFSWNYGQSSGQSYRLLRAWPHQKCHSSDSIHSSSGVSSSCSAQGSASSDCGVNLEASNLEKSEISNLSKKLSDEEESTEDDRNIKIDVGEMEDGISSVKIKLPQTKQDKATKADLIRMKHLLLNDNTCDATEV